MTILDEIPITIGPPAAPITDFGNATPILAEIRHAVARLAASGEGTSIDLAALPFGPGDEDRLMTLLGRGEVQATIDALGPTRIRETRFPGVWVVDYTNADDQRVSLQIEVNLVPAILRTQSADLDDSVAALDACLAAATGAAPLNPAPDPGP